MFNNYPISNIYNRMVNSQDPTINTEEKQYINDIIDYCLTTKTIPDEIYNNTYNAILICNSIYNNIPNIITPLPDYKYDAFITLAKNLNKTMPIGAPPVKYKQVSNIDIEANTTSKKNYIDGKLEIVQQIPNYKERKYFINMVSNMTPPMKEDFIINHDDTLVERRMRNTKSDFNLCGSLDKCKYVLNFDAQSEGAFQDPSVDVFERDFIMKHINEGLLDPNNILGVVSLKYDGISIEQTIQNDTVIKAVTRGNTDSNEVSDLTPIFSGYKYARASNFQINQGEPFGLKSEFIITAENLKRVERDFGKTYANMRNAIIGLTGGLDARLYRDYLTPVPLETSLNINRDFEIEFMNKYYTKGIDFRSAIVQGNYQEVIQQVKIFKEEAETLRDYMPFMYDGIVFEYINSNIRNVLGKRASIPRYAIAIKFNPMKKETTLTHITYTVSKNGGIIPIAHYEPVEFMNAINTLTTLHSYERFKQLNLRIGDKVEIVLVNDVIPYLRRLPEQYQDPNNKNPVIEFPDNCPACGSPVYISDTAKSAFCLNFMCPERCLGRLGDMIKKLGIKDFSDLTIRALNVYNFRDLYHYDRVKAASILGPNRSVTFFQELENLKTANLPDYKWVGSIGFSNIAEKTWKLILEQFSFERLINNESLDTLIAVKGVGQATIQTIEKELPYLYDDLIFIYQNFKFEKSVYNSVIKPRVVFTGIRDASLEKKFTDLGYDVSDGGVTKDTIILIVPTIGHRSNKVMKAFDYLSKDYMRKYQKPAPIFGWDNLYMAKGLHPIIMDVDQAYRFSTINEYE